MAKTFSKIIRDYDKREYHVQKPTITKLREGFVFDEDLSVKKNREMVEEHNNKVDEAWKDYRMGSGILNKKLEDDIIESIIDGSNDKLNEKQARYIYEYANREYHSGGLSEVINGVIDLMQLAENILE